MSSPSDQPAETTASETTAFEAMSYEQARHALGEVVALLEAGGTPLEESIALWERGEKLAAVCQRLLDGAQQRLDDVIARTEADED